MTLNAQDFSNGPHVASATLVNGGYQALNVTVPGQMDQSVQWVIPAGAGRVVGEIYQAPATPGTYTLTAVRNADPTLTGTFTVRVRTTDLNGNGVTEMDFGDLAFLADAYGQTPGAGLADLNGDGVVDDLDAALFLSVFGGDQEGLNEDVPFQSVDEILERRRDGDLFRYLLEKFASFSGISGVQPKILFRDEKAFEAGERMLQEWETGSTRSLRG